MGRVGVRMWRSSGREASVAGAADAVLVLLKAGATIDTKAPSASGFALPTLSLFAPRIMVYLRNNTMTSNELTKSTSTEQTWFTIHTTTGPLIFGLY